jgi:hypothetical protein
MTIYFYFSVCCELLRQNIADEVRLMITPRGEVDDDDGVQKSPGEVEVHECR